MTDERYHAYRQVMAALATDGAAVLSSTERELLRDAAEGYLLMRSPADEEAPDLAANVAAVLDALVESRRWREETATAVRAAIHACGPRLEPVPA
jgi:ABC-type nitrate/sulfonate/bicarbonate transport system substrate-binding protein